jgi:two-component system alkaline phosphatase synthesis response regulator PhoP
MNWNCSSVAFAGKIGYNIIDILFRRGGNMIYLLEDDSGIRDFVLYALRSAGFSAEGFELPSQLRKALAEKLPELLLLDIMLPEEDGISVLNSLRAQPETASLPVIMLTAKSTEFDKVAGLDAGADDYIAKPFGTMELIARVKALIRRSSGVRGSELRLGELRIDPEKHEVFSGGSKVSLTRKEYDLLILLVRNKGKVFTREELLSRIWGYDYAGESRTVDVHIRTLRSKLGSCGELIGTERGVGYKAGDEQ